jgi:hypothetical protein
VNGVVNGAVIDMWFATEDRFPIDNRLWAWNKFSIGNKLWVWNRFPIEERFRIRNKLQMRNLTMNGNVWWWDRCRLIVNKR